MKNNKGFSLVSVMVSLGIMSIISMTLISLTVQSIKVSNTARIDSDILSYVSVLKARLNALGSLPSYDTTVGQGWSVRRIIATTQTLNHVDITSYRAVFVRDSENIIGPEIVSRELGTIAVAAPAQNQGGGEHHDDDDDDRDGGCNHNH